MHRSCTEIPGSLQGTHLADGQVDGGQCQEADTTTYRMCVRVNHKTGDSEQKKFMRGPDELREVDAGCLAAIWSTGRGRKGRCSGDVISWNRHPSLLATSGQRGVLRGREGCRWAGGQT